MFNILVVEDDNNARKLMCDVLRTAGYEPSPAEDGEAALELMDHQHIDLAIVDIMMPKMDGYEFTRTLREAKCNLPILMATAMVAREDKWRGFSVGVDDYMVKPLDEEELLWRVAALLRRSKIASERRLTVGQTTLNYDAFSVTTEKGTQILPPKEFLLLFKLLSYPETIFTRRQLMDEIWNMDSDTDERTVDSHINRIREKFGDSPDFEIVTIRGLGYEAVIKR